MCSHVMVRSNRFAAPTSSSPDAEVIIKRAQACSVWNHVDRLRALRDGALQHRIDLDTNMEKLDSRITELMINEM